MPDSLGRPSTITDGKGQKATYTYDGDDRITQLLFGGATTCVLTAGTCVQYTYDDAGNLTTRKDVTGTTTYTYDFAQRPTGLTTPQGATSATYDLVGNVATFADPTGTYQYGYDAVNNATNVVEPGGTKTNCGTSGTLCTLFGFDNNNRPKAITYPNGVTETLGYNSAGQQTSIVAKRPAGTTFVSLSYSYTTSAGKNVALRQSVTDNVAATTTSYTYDGLARLKTATATGSSYSYSYDAAGNITQTVINGTTTNHTYNAADELTDTGVTYDADGNITAKSGQTYAYNSLNQTSSITTSGVARAMAYADVGQTERTSSGTTSFLNGLLGLTRQTGGSTLGFARTPSGGLVSMISGTSHFYYVLDALGSVVRLTDASGNDAAAVAVTGRRERTDSIASACRRRRPSCQRQGGTSGRTARTSSSSSPEAA